MEDRAFKYARTMLRLSPTGRTHGGTATTKFPQVPISCTHISAQTLGPYIAYSVPSADGHVGGGGGCRRITIVVELERRRGVKEESAQAAASERGRRFPGSSFAAVQEINIRC